MEGVVFEDTSFPEDKKPRHDEDQYWRNEYTRLSQKYADLKCAARKMALSVNGTNNTEAELMKEVVELKKQVIYWQQQHSREVDQNEQLRYDLVNQKAKEVDGCCKECDVCDMKLMKVYSVATLNMKETEKPDIFG